MLIEGKLKLLCSCEREIFSTIYDRFKLSHTFRAFSVGMKCEMSSGEFVYARAFSPVPRCSHIASPKWLKNVNCSRPWAKRIFPYFLIFFKFCSYLLPISSEPDCPSLVDADKLSQTQLIKRLTHSCRYDRLERPASNLHGTKIFFQK